MCRAYCVRQTWSCAHPGTNRSGSCRSRRWRVAYRSLQPRWRRPQRHSSRRRHGLSRARTCAGGFGAGGRTADCVAFPQAPPRGCRTGAGRRTLHLGARCARHSARISQRRVPLDALDRAKLGLPMKRPSLVILRPLGLGDFLTGVPAYRGLIRAFPTHRIVLAAPRRFAGLAALVGGIDDVVDTLPLLPLAAELSPCRTSQSICTDVVRPANASCWPRSRSD